MDEIKKVYIDSRCKNNGSESNSDFKFELKEGFDLPDILYVMLMIYVSPTPGEQSNLIIINFTYFQELRL